MCVCVVRETARQRVIARDSWRDSEGGREGGREGGSKQQQGMHHYLALLLQCCTHSAVWPWLVHSWPWLLKHISR